MAALTHKPPDRTPLNYYGTPETTLKLQNHLGLATHEELLCYFGADMRYVGTRYVGPAEFVGLSGYAEAGTDVWGIVWEAVA
ncbi:MAG: hypothetical protein QGF59_03415, partial [Pirellulaceae bacterium]|nr:hypothetical protein [Pirellulaceae bacterium]